eukprot:m.112356 g.112356  ORF g.112356 m.112356 type:complete len:579 (+) comp19275_c0_seq1:67-1803(+)
MSELARCLLAHPSAADDELSAALQANVSATEPFSAELMTSADVVAAIISLFDRPVPESRRLLYRLFVSWYTTSSAQPCIFVMQFLPDIIWDYLSDVLQRARPAAPDVVTAEKCLVHIFNTSAALEGEYAFADSEFRMPSLALSSLYHEPIGHRTAPKITAKTLNQLQQGQSRKLKFTEISCVLATIRNDVLAYLMRLHNGHLAAFHVLTRIRVCLLAERCAVTGQSALDSNNGRLTLSETLVNELAAGLVYLAFCGEQESATRALSHLHTRAVADVLCGSILVTEHALRSTTPRTSASSPPPPPPHSPQQHGSSSSSTGSAALSASGTASASASGRASSPNGTHGLQCLDVFHDLDLLCPATISPRQTRVLGLATRQPSRGALVPSQIPAMFMGNMHHKAPPLDTVAESPSTASLASAMTAMTAMARPRISVEDVELSVISEEMLMGEGSTLSEEDENAAARSTPSSAAVATLVAAVAAAEAEAEAAVASADEVDEIDTDGVGIAMTHRPSAHSITTGGAAAGDAAADKSRAGPDALSRSSTSSSVASAARAPLSRGPSAPSVIKKMLTKPGAVESLV